MINARFGAWLAATKLRSRPSAARPTRLRPLAHGGNLGRLDGPSSCGDGAQPSLSASRSDRDRGTNNRIRQLNGKVERSHRTDKDEFYQLLTYRDDVDLEKKLAVWEHFYNFDRPHGAHSGKTPYEALREKLS